ncbi:hypothetical protein [Dysgonomonas sp. GY617]|uniref:hypothetical protein n=1 Tax=Dysgonomonas sp. GY617 TaxID=2780420 RepID=UPI0018844FCC|nr:hypothetical protein [Dysgonomonas sp. GY617]MBF0574445.1 hypothetical protein [Dysgonomonas sp. GY617]
MINLFLCTGIVVFNQIRVNITYLKALFDFRASIVDAATSDDLMASCLALTQLASKNNRCLVASSGTLVY